MTEKEKTNNNNKPNNLNNEIEIEDDNLSKPDSDSGTSNFADEKYQEHLLEIVNNYNL